MTAAFKAGDRIRGTRFQPHPRFGTVLRDSHNGLVEVCFDAETESERVQTSEIFPALHGFAELVAEIESELSRHGTPGLRLDPVALADLCRVLRHGLEPR